MLRPFFLSLFTRVRRRSQRVENVDVERRMTRNRAWKAPKPACLVPHSGRKWAPTGFFNTLEYSANFAFSEVGSVRS